MHTQDELRAGMNALALATEPLPASAVLHDAKRYRTRRRLVAAAGTAVTVIAVAGGAVFAAPSLTGRDPSGPGVVTGASPAVTSGAPAASGMPRGQRFVFDKEYQSDSGVHTTLITDKLFPGLEPETELRADRVPGRSTAPTGEDEQASDAVRYLTVAGVRVRVDEFDVADGTRSQLTWSWKDTGYVLSASRGTTDDGVAYGATDDDLTWVIEQVMSRNPK